MEGEIQGLSVEHRGIERTTVPLHHLLMFGTSRIAHHPGEMGVAAHSTDVFWRARSGSAENPRIASARTMIDGFLQQELVLTAFAEIILLDRLNDVRLSEEVPRAGKVVTRGFQRARWFDGGTLVWVGRRATTGRGEGSSGLAFDQIVDTPRPLA